MLSERQEQLDVSNLLSQSDLIQDRPTTEAERSRLQRNTFQSLLTLLRPSKGASREMQAAALVEANDLSVRLADLLVVRTYTAGEGERLEESPDTSQVRRQLAPYGVRYGSFEHYSGALQYDNALLQRAWKEFPDTQSGQRAFLSVQQLNCSITGCYQAIIQQGEQFLRTYPRTRFRKEQLYKLALANDTWWSLNQTSEAARTRAIQLYEELIREYPASPEARSGQLKLPRLKLKLSTGERTFAPSME